MRPCPNILRRAAWVTFAFAFGFAGCGNDPAKTRDARHEFHYATIDEPRRLDPAHIRDLYEGIVSGLIFDGLVGFGRGTEIEPRLAEAWDISADGRIYTFRLRDAKFSNGKPVTSADVRYSLTRVLQHATLSDRKWVLDRIDGAQEVTSGTETELRGIRTPDPHTVVIILREPYPVFLTMLAMPTASIIPADSAGAGRAESPFDRNPVGTGPWVLEKWLRDQRLEFRRNPGFWGTPPKLDRFIYNVQVDDNVRRQQFEAGNFDIYEVGFAVYQAWSQNPGKRARMVPVQELRTDFLGFMNHKPKFADRRVRQAIAHAINRGSIFENLQKGRGVIAHGPVPPGIPGYRPGIAPRKFDPDLARSLLTDAGATGLELDLWYRDEALWSEIVRAVKTDLEKAGVRVRLVPRDLAALRTGIRAGEPDIYLGSWTLDYPDMENALVPTFHSRNIPFQGNGSHFSNPAVDRLIEEAERETDAQKRLARYHAVEDAVMEECPWIFLFHRCAYYVVQPNVRNWNPAVMYNADRYVGVEKF